MCGAVVTIDVHGRLLGIAMQAIGFGVEDDAACPDGLEVLDAEGVGEEALGLSSYGDLEGTGAHGIATSAGGFGEAGPLAGGQVHALEGIKVIGKGVDEVSYGVLAQEPHGQKLGHQGSGFAGADIAGRDEGLFIELEAVG